MCHPLPSWHCFSLPRTCSCLGLWLFPSLLSQPTPFPIHHCNCILTLEVPHLILTFQRQLPPQKSLDSILLVFIYRSSLAFNIGQKPTTSWKWPARCFLAKFWPQALSSLSIPHWGHSFSLAFPACTHHSGTTSFLLRESSNKSPSFISVLGRETAEWTT